MFDKSTFCILPWSSIQINPSGDMKICCFSGSPSGSSGNNHGMCVDEDGNVMNILTHSIEDAMNSRYHKEIRLFQSKNLRHPMCKICWDRDDANAKMDQHSTSLRHWRSFIQLPHLDNAITLEKAPSVINTNGSIDEMPISLDLRFTNKCNMKCVMCDSKYSNQWYKDEMLLYGKNTLHMDSKVYNITVENGVYKDDMPAWHDSPIWWQKFDAIKRRVRHLYLTGGEPFIIKGHDVLLDTLIECGAAKDVVLEYDTNLSVINDKILERFKHFKQIVISVSCDDIEERYDLIRFGGNFQTLVNNLEKLKNRNIEIRHISSCTGIYSLYSPMRLHEYFVPLGYNRFSFRFLRAPYHSDISFLPDRLKYKMIKVYDESNLSTLWKNFYIGHLKNTLGTHTNRESDERMYAHINYLNSLDKIRETDWKHTLPEIVELLKDYM